MDEVAENSEALMERYPRRRNLHDEIVNALEDGADHGLIFPVTCGVATTRLGARTSLDAIVDDLPRPVQHASVEVEEGFTLEPDPDGEMFAYVFKTRADPFAGRINLFRVYQGTMTHDTQVMNTRAHTRSVSAAACAAPARTSAIPTRSGQATSAPWPVQGDAGDSLAGARADPHAARIKLQRPGHGLRHGAEEQGRRGQGLHRPAAPAGGARRSTCTATSRPASRSWPGCRGSTSK